MVTSSGRLVAQSLGLLVMRDRNRTPATTKGTPKGAQSRVIGQASLLARALSGRGSSKAAMVEVAGIEPASAGISMSILRAQLVVSCRVRKPTSDFSTPYPYCGVPRCR